MILPCIISVTIMSSSSGLQRRRGVHTTGVDDDTGEGGVHEKRVSAIEKVSGSGSISTYDSKRGHRLAYDPRDLADENEEQTYPRITLMEEVLLLGLKDTQGYLSFWNDKLSFALRGCILMELALRGRIRVMSGAEQKRRDVGERTIELMNAKLTNDPLLDETIRHIQSSSPTSVAEWMDLLSGETWNMMRLSMQLKQVRERLCKGLVEKGILRTEKRNFLLFDMPTHPIADMSVKDAVRRRVYAITSAQSIHAESLYKEENSAGGRVSLPVTRTMCMVTTALCADVLENVLQHLPLQAQEIATQHVEHLVEEFSQWPMAPQTSGGGIPPQGSMDAMLARPINSSRSSVSKKGRQKMGVSIEDLTKAMRHEYDTGAHESAYEVIAAVLSVFLQMDAIV